MKIARNKILGKLKALLKVFAPSPYLRLCHHHNNNHYNDNMIISTTDEMLKMYTKGSF